MRFERCKVHVADSEAAEALRADTAFRVVEIRGRIRTKRELLEYVATELGFPEYFGGNWDALEECLQDIDTPTLLLVHDAAELWKRLGDDMVPFVDVWTTSAPTNVHLVFIW